MFLEKREYLGRCFLFFSQEKEDRMNLYSYIGPVTEFGKCIDNHWSGSTYAPSIKKARSNLTYQYKKKHNKLPAAKINLPGKIILVA